MPLAGTWYNQLGSRMELTVYQGKVSGWYETAVGSAAGRYELAGRTDTDDDSARNVGWVVSWENDKGSSDSVTTWSGELQTINGEAIISTTWLLTIETAPDANWKSTLIGKDIFTRTPPDKESSKKAFLIGMCSHPL